MNTQIRIAIAAAAVVVLALIVVNVLPKSNSVGGPAPSPNPTAVPSPTTAALPDVPVTLKPGTYTAGDPFLVRATFTLPSGWEGNIGGPYAVFLDQGPEGGSGSLNFSIFSEVAANPCHYNGFASPPVGPSVDALASALAALPGVTATTPTAVSLGGYQGKQLTLTAPASFAGCTLTSDGQFRIWQLPLGATNDMAAGERDQIWILDVSGQRLVIDTPQPTDETAPEAAEVLAVVNSIHLAPATPASSAPASSGAASSTP